MKRLIAALLSVVLVGLAMSAAAGNDESTPSEEPVKTLNTRFNKTVIVPGQKLVVVRTFAPGTASHEAVADFVQHYFASDGTPGYAELEFSNIDTIRFKFSLESRRAGSEQVAWKGVKPMLSALDSDVKWSAKFCATHEGKATSLADAYAVKATFRSSCDGSGKCYWTIGQLSLHAVGSCSPVTPWDPV